MSRSRPLPISASVDVAAPVDRVWAVISDVTRMPEWSPELRRLYPLGDRAPGVGMKMTGINRRGYALWPTRSTVVRFEPERAVAWKTRESGATWIYEVEPTATGTRLTGRRELSTYTRGTALFALVIGGAANHDRELADGIRATLDRIRTTVEAAHQL